MPFRFSWVVAQISRIWETVRSSSREKRGAFHGHHHRSLPSTLRRDALVRNGHAPNGKQLSRCRACGRQSRENPTPHAYPEARREEILHASQEREPPARSHAHGSRVSRTTVSSWITKKELSFRLCGPPCSLQIPKIPRPPSWNPIGSGRLSSKKRTTPGCGLPFAAKRDRWSPLRLGIGANRRVSGCGKPFQRGIARGIAEPPSGRPTRR